MEDGKSKTLSSLIDATGAKDQESIWELRRRLETETGVPMEDDDLGTGEEELVAAILPTIEAKLPD